MRPRSTSPLFPYTTLFRSQAASRALAQELYILKASNEGEIDAAFATLVQRGARALLVGADPFFNSRRDQLIALAARHAVPDRKSTRLNSSHRCTSYAVFCL